MAMTSRVKLPVCLSVCLSVSVWSAWQHVVAVVRSGHEQTGNGTRVACRTLPTAFCARIYSVWWVEGAVDNRQMCRSVCVSVCVCVCVCLSVCLSTAESISFVCTL